MFFLRNNASGRGAGDVPLRRSSGGTAPAGAFLLPDAVALGLLTRVLALFLLVAVSFPAGAGAADLNFQTPPVDLSNFKDDLDLGDYKSTAKPKASTSKVVFRKDRLFGTVEFRSKLKNLPKWQRILKIYKDKPGIDAAFQVSNRKREAQAWTSLKGSLSGKSALEKVKGINSFFNQWPYRTDNQVYKLNDYWATPDEFIKNSGDCEDYAIVKFYALKQLGVNPNSMRLVILKDTIRNLDHAVLAVYIGEDVYILDNVTQMVLTHENYRHYRPYYSLSEVYRWAHVPPSNK